MGDYIDDPLGTGKQVNLCSYVETYWGTEDGNKDGNKDGKKDSKHPLPSLNGDTPKPAIKLIADQFPSTKSNPKELILLTGAVNGLKEAVSCILSWGPSSETPASRLSLIG